MCIRFYSVMSWHNNSSRCNSLKIIALRVNVMSDEFF